MAKRKTLSYTDADMGIENENNFNELQRVHKSLQAR
jgi:hypothetical protein